MVVDFQKAPKVIFLPFLVAYNFIGNSTRLFMLVVLIICCWQGYELSSWMQTRTDYSLWFKAKV